MSSLHQGFQQTGESGGTEAVLKQMVRLTRPGGSVLAFDFDSDQTVVDAPDPALAPQEQAQGGSATPTSTCPAPVRAGRRGRSRSRVVLGDRKRMRNGPESGWRTR